ncbi:MAG: hypothetical protein QG597_136 [Actinomycetota bacterium]|nr:hypothetical protein [Actinomycetota bacterium]
MSVPSPEVLTATIAAKARVDPRIVGTVLKAQGVSLVPVPPTTRSLDIRRLCLSGTRVNTVWDGPFEKSFEFSAGVTALITDQNLRGKSTVLELISWALRGSPRRLRDDVQPWFSRIVLEYSVNGIPMAVVMRKDASGMVVDILRSSDASVLSAYLAGEDVPASSVHVVAGGLAEAAFNAQQQELMLSMLQLEPITNFQTRQGSDQGDLRENGWPAYFGGVYLPQASSDALFGDTVFAALPARILQLFCNVPLMSSQIRLKTMGKLRRQDEENQHRRLVEDADARASERVELLTELEEVTAKLAELPSESGRTYAVIADELGKAERTLESQSSASRGATATLEEAKAARQAEELRVNSVRETELAVLLFQGLTPKHCPRCEQEIERQRTVKEDTDHECSVCTKPFPGADADTGDEGEVEEVVDALEALGSAEEAARDSALAASAALVEARGEVERLAVELAGASRSDEFTSRLKLQLEKARLEGRVAGVPERPTELQRSESLRVIEAAAEVLNRVTGEAAKKVFEDLNAEILDLGRKFGINNLESIALNRQGGMDVTTAGVKVPFTRTTGGERLRLRVATVVALLRIGARAGVGSHPGLLLLDSPGSDELTVHDEATLLEELDSLKTELPGLQVVIASAEPAAVQGHVPEENVYSSLDGTPLW